MPKNGNERSNVKLLIQVYKRHRPVRVTVERIKISIRISVD